MAIRSIVADFGPFSFDSNIGNQSFTVHATVMIRIVDHDFTYNEYNLSLRGLKIGE